jgi:hypothetical protein
MNHVRWGAHGSTVVPRFPSVRITYWSTYINQEMRCSAQPPWMVTVLPIALDMDTVTTTQRRNDHTC